MNTPIHSGNGSGAGPMGRGVRLRGLFSGENTWTRRGLTAAAFLLCVAALTREPSPDLLAPADMNAPVSDREIRAAFYFETVDLQRTQEARDAEMAEVPSFYRVDGQAVNRQTRKLREKIGLLRDQREEVRRLVLAALGESTSDQDAWQVAERAVAAHAARLREKDAWAEMPAPDLLTLWLLPDRASLPEREFAPPPKNGPEEAPLKTVALKNGPNGDLSFNDSDRMGSLALEGLQALLSEGVREQELTDAEQARRILVVQEETDTPVEQGGETTLGAVLDPLEGAARLGNLLTDMAKRSAPSKEGQPEWARLHDAALALARPLVAPTLVEDKVATASARAQAAEAVPPVMKEVEAGEIVQDRGKRWTKQSRSDAQTYLSILAREARPLQRLVNSFFAHTLLVLLCFGALARASKMYPAGPEGARFRAASAKSFPMVLVLLCGTLVMGRLVSYFEPTGYVAPVAAAGILCAILAGAPLAAFFSVSAAVLMSAQYQYNWRLMLVACAMAVAGSFSIGRVRKRSEMTAASLTAMLAGLLAAAAVTLSAESLFAETFFRRLMLIALNGGFCMVAVPGLLSTIERAFGLTTDITLLEYSDLNSTILNELAIKAPATYAHSLMMGQLAEAAADAIGANGLLARVCAYYHDIGKLVNSEQYTENQSGSNIHDTLPPEESAARIRQHVIGGVELARRYRLPQAIIDGILEHHGTMRVSFFYQAAVEKYGAEKVNEADYRYPGPRPQRPETAILMICDASESGVRSLDNPDEAAVRAFVGQIIEARIRDGQFDDCNLTFRQLNTIGNVVARRIISAQHTRVRYPGMPAIPSPATERNPS